MKSESEKFDYSKIHETHDEFLDKIRDLFRNISTKDLELIENPQFIEHEPKKECNDVAHAKKLYCDVIAIYPEFKVEGGEVFFMDVVLEKLQVPDYRTYMDNRCNYLQDKNIGRLSFDFKMQKGNHLTGEYIYFNIFLK